MVDASVRFIASGLAIVIGVCAVAPFAREAIHAPVALATSDVSARLGKRSLVATPDEANAPTLALATDADAARALCGGLASAALLGRALTHDETAACESRGKTPHEARVAFAATAIAVPVDNAFVDALSLDQLRRIFGRAPGERLTFHEVDARWPDVEVLALGVGQRDGASAVLQERLGDEVRLSFRASATADDVAAAVAENAGAIGFFGAAHPGVFAHAIRLVAIRGRGGEAFYPTRDALESDSYPLGTALWLAFDAATDRGEADSFSATFTASIARAASASDCLAAADRAPPARVAER